MTTRQVEKLVAEWQHRLRLDDWDIEVVAIAAEKVDHQLECYGLCYTTKNARAAKIMVAAGQVDPENTVIHELLHLVLDEVSRVHERAADQLGADGGEISRANYSTAENITIQSLTETLLKVHRGIK